MSKKAYFTLVSVTIVFICIWICVLQIKEERMQITRYLTVCPQDVRRHYIDETCRTKNLSATSDEFQLMVDLPHKLAYCLIPKAASRTMRSVLGSALIGNDSYEPNQDFLEIPGIYAYTKLPTNIQEEVIGKFKKLIVVRHPYDRIVSVFSSKLVTRKMIIDVLEKNVPHINRYLTKINGKKTKFDPAVDKLTFEEFAGLISSEYDNGFRNGHWNTMFEHCRPCSVRYDFVLRLETLDIDYRVLASYLRPPKRLHQSVPYNDKMKSSLLDPEEKLFNLLWRFQKLDQEILDGIRRVYQHDMDVFGYSWNDQKGATCRIPFGDGKYCC